MLISIVDDDESVREALPDLLKTLGFEVRTFACAEDFLISSAAMEATDCLILDVCLPGISGPQLHRELRLRRPDLPIIFMSGQVDAALEDRDSATRPVKCLLKPFNTHELCSSLGEALGLPQWAGQLRQNPA